MYLPLLYKIFVINQWMPVYTHQNGGYGLILPIFKNGDELDPQNYRGITIMDTLSKNN